MAMNVNLSYTALSFIVIVWPDHAVGVRIPAN